MFIKHELKIFGSEIKLSLAITSLLTLLLLYFVWDKTSSLNIVVSIIYFVTLYFLFFLIGIPKTEKKLGKIINSDIKRAIIFPTFLVLTYYSYIIINDGNPLKGTVFLFPFLIFFPVIIFIARKNDSKKIDWIDFFTFTLFLLPATLVKFEPSSEIPISGGGFDSVLRIEIIELLRNKKPLKIEKYA